MSPQGRPRTKKEPKRKAVKVRLCAREHAGKVTEPWRIMEAIVAGERKDLDGLKIGIAWHAGWRPDADGVRTNGKCVKRSDLDRSLDGYDAMIILNEQSWGAFSDNDKYRLLAHELEHIQIASDKNGEPLIDDKGRPVIRLKRHDVSDFASIIKRFGPPPCLTDVDIADADRPLLKLAEEKDDVGPQRDLREEIPLKFTGLRAAKASLTVTRTADGWRAGYSLQLGNLEHRELPEDTLTKNDRPFAIRRAIKKMVRWLEDVEPTGNAAARRSLTRRLTQMCEQIETQGRHLIRDLVDEDEDLEPVEFEEDPELTPDEDEDQDSEE